MTRVGATTSWTVPRSLMPILTPGCGNSRASSADGTSMITENVFESRWMFVNELVRLGADVRVDGHHAVVRGRERLSSAPVVATDIRAGAGLVRRGLRAEKVSREEP